MVALLTDWQCVLHKNNTIFAKGPRISELLVEQFFFCGGRVYIYQYSQQTQLEFLSQVGQHYNIFSL